MRDWGGGVTYLDTIQEIFLLCCLSLSDSWIRLVIFNLFLRIFLDGRTNFLLPLFSVSKVER